MQVPVNKIAGADNPNPAIHFVSQGHDTDIGSSGQRFAVDFLGMACHGDSHTHVDALCHVSWNGRDIQRLACTGGRHVPRRHDIGHPGIRRNGLVGRGVLLDMARHRQVPWLEPGEVVTRAELEACEASVGQRLGPADILVFRTGHHRRRREIGPRNNDYPPGEGRAGLHVDAAAWMHERGIAAFLPDYDGEVVPSTVEGVLYPIYVLQIVAMGMLAADLLVWRRSPLPARRSAVGSSWSWDCHFGYRAGRGPP